MIDWLSLFPFLGIVAAAALSGVKFMPGHWYSTLQKPSWTPPDWLFGPAWTILYIMIAVAGWLVWSVEGAGVALAVWCLNLGFNAAWSWLMFGRHRIGWAFMDAMAMLVTILAFLIIARPISSTAALLFIPYLGWVAFAAALNFEILQRNGSAA
ncbi:TspO/MBR family protein [Hyphomicrobium sp.]|uniref:TspO/MBR family protein n=1 Tax=Hyphomicrobium sp. TaxID=82 RepID=UPI0035618A36